MIKVMASGITALFIFSAFLSLATFSSYHVNEREAVKVAKAELFLLGKSGGYSVKNLKMVKENGKILFYVFHHIISCHDHIYLFIFISHSQEKKI